MQRVANGIPYELTYKRVKNINLRVTASGVYVSANKRVGIRAIDAFVAGKAEWIERARARVSASAPKESQKGREECAALFSQVSERVFPLFSAVLAQKPAIRVRTMKTRWGVCHYAKNTVVLSRALADMPLPFIEYVIAHEYAHFLHHDHQAGFHALMREVMPDYKERRKLARQAGMKDTGE